MARAGRLPGGGRAAQGAGGGHAADRERLSRGFGVAGARVGGRPSAEDVSGCASWYPVHDAAGHLLGVGLILLNVAGPSAEAAEAAASAAAEIRLSEERYRSLVQGGAQVVWVAAAGRLDEGRLARAGAGSPASPRSSTPGSAGWTRCTRRTGSGSSGTGGSASGPGRSATTGTGSAPRAAPTGTTTSARCRSSETAGSPSGSAPAPT